MKTKAVDDVTYVQVHELKHDDRACEGCVGDDNGGLCNELGDCSAGVIGNDGRGHIWIVDSEPARVAYITLKLEAS